MKINCFKIILLLTFQLFVLNLLLSQSHSWLIIDVPTPMPVKGTTFTTDIKLASWNGNPGATDFTISFDPKVLNLKSVSIPESSVLSPNIFVDSLSKPGEIHFACFKIADSVSWNKVKTIGTITWNCPFVQDRITDISIKVRDHIESSWNSVDVETFGQHVEFFAFDYKSDPNQIHLGYCYPNPFSSFTTIEYYLNEETKVSFIIYDVKGKFITSLYDKNQTQGQHLLVWNGTDSNGSYVNSGIYFCKLSAGSIQKNIKLLLLK